MYAKQTALFITLIVFLCLTGCSVRIINLTPTEIPTSASGTYTLKALADIGRNTVFPDSLEAFVIIDGKQYPMIQQPANDYLFEYNYKPSDEKSAFQFYYKLNYIIKKNNQTPAFKQTTSDLQQVELTYSNRLKINRQHAPIDTEVSVYGDQFTVRDQVLVNGILCKTSRISSQELQFVVPEISPKFNYPVEVRTPKGIFKAGSLRVDPANPLKVTPQKLALRLGQPQALVFMLDYPAPSGGLYLEITTDIPDSIIMPEALIPEGSRTISVIVDSKNIANGNLFIQAGELPEIIVPVTIR